MSPVTSVFFFVSHVLLSVDPFFFSVASVIQSVSLFIVCVILNSTWHHRPQVVNTPSMVSNIGRGRHSIGVSSIGYWGSIGNWGNNSNIGLSSNLLMDIGLCSNAMSFHRLFMDISFSCNFFMHIRLGSNLFMDIPSRRWGVFRSRSSCCSSNDRQQDKELHDGVFWTRIPMYSAL